MDERIRPTRSGLFAIELLTAIGVFSLCAAICIGLFVRAEVVSQDSADLTQAVSAARSVAEDFKAAGGDLARTAELSGGTTSQDGLLLDFNEDWFPENSGGDGVFHLELSPAQGGGCARASLSVTGRDGAVLLHWDLAALEVAP